MIWMVELGLYEWSLVLEMVVALTLPTGYLHVSWLVLEMVVVPLLPRGFSV